MKQLPSDVQIETAAQDEYGKSTTPRPGFGRVYLPNPGSRNFPLRAVLPRRSASSWKTKVWRMGRGLWYRSQKTTSQCVRYGIMHALMLEGIVRAEAFALTAGLYRWAQDNDPWPGREPDYYGTSVDAGLRYCRHYHEITGAEKPLTLEDRWARDMDDVLTRLTLPASEGGGVLVAGTDYYEGMDGDGSNVRGDPRNKAEPTGELWGGHCYALTGTLAPTARKPRKITCGNSHDGNFEFEMDADAMEWLLFAQNGEAAAVTEAPR